MILILKILWAEKCWEDGQYFFIVWWNNLEGFLNLINRYLFSGWFLVGFIKTKFKKKQVKRKELLQTYTTCLVHQAHILLHNNRINIRRVYHWPSVEQIVLICQLPYIYICVWSWFTEATEVLRLAFNVFDKYGNKFKCWYL